MGFDQMALGGGDVSQHYSLPGVRSLSSASNPADMTEDRRLPPLPRFEPVQRDVFNPFAHRSFMPSPPSTHDSFPTKSPWPTAEHIVAPPSPANSADSWAGSTQYQRSSRYTPDPSQLRKPLQQQCGRKRKGSMAAFDQDDQREKHRVAEGKRRKNLSDHTQQLDERLHSSFLEQVGWNPAKSQSPSKEQILGATVLYIDTMRAIFLSSHQENKLPCDIPEKIIQPQLRCVQLQKLNSSLQHQFQTAQQQVNLLKQDTHALVKRNREVEERCRELTYQVNALHLSGTPKSEQPSLQHAVSLPDSNSGATLPALRVLCEKISASSPDSSRYDALSPASSQFFGHAFLSHTPPTTGPSSPVFHQATYSVTTSRPPSLAQSPSP
ncbi:hypothetical protein BDV12DRAFT_160452 [Aspergillus spectabilis]